jgi:hypothetical protein
VAAALWEWLSWCTARTALFCGAKVGVWVVGTVCVLPGACCVVHTESAPCAAAVVDEQQQLVFWTPCRACLLLLRAILFPACGDTALGFSGVCSFVPPSCYVLALSVGHGMRGIRLFPSSGLRGLHGVAWGVCVLCFRLQQQQPHCRCLACRSPSSLTCKTACRPGVFVPFPFVPCRCVTGECIPSLPAVSVCVCVCLCV